MNDEATEESREVKKYMEQIADQVIEDLPEDWRPTLRSAPVILVLRLAVAKGYRIGHQDCEESLVKGLMEAAINAVALDAN